MTPAEMARLHAACFTAPPPWSADAFAGLLDSPTCFSVCAPAGFALGRVVAGEAELLTLAVDPAHRRAGHGQALLHGFEAEARARGASEAFLEVAADNAAAQALYRVSGYARAGRRPGYYCLPGQAPVDALLLRRAL